MGTVNRRRCAPTAEFGIEPTITSPQEFAAIIAQEVPKWADVVRTTGVNEPGRLMRSVVFAIAIVAGAWYGLSVTPRRHRRRIGPRGHQDHHAARGRRRADILGRTVGEALTLDVKRSVVIETVRRRRRARGTDRRTRGAGRRDVAARNGRGFDDRAVLVAPWMGGRSHSVDAGRRAAGVPRRRQRCRSATSGS